MELRDIDPAFPAQACNAYYVRQGWKMVGEEYADEGL